MKNKEKFQTYGNSIFGFILYCREHNCEECPHYKKGLVDQIGIREAMKGCFDEWLEMDVIAEESLDEHLKDFRKHLRDDHDVKIKERDIRIIISHQKALEKLLKLYERDFKDGREVRKAMGVTTIDEDDV